MSADFWSFVTPLESGRSRELFRRLRPQEYRGEVYGPRGDIVHRFEAGRSVDFAALRNACDGRAYRNLGRAYVEATIDELEPLLDEDLVVSSPYAALVAMDRAFALPRGIEFLGGGALRHLAHEELFNFKGVVSSLSEPVGVAARVEELAAHLDRSASGQRDAQQMWDVLIAAVERALSDKLDLLLVGAVAP